MSDKILSILDANGIMTVATNRPDGWPQATIVSYVNVGVFLYFLIARTSQKFENISADSRISLTVGAEAGRPSGIEGVSMAANAYELKPPYGQPYLAKLSARHPGYFDPEALDVNLTALMWASPHIISVIDFSQGLGHAETLSMGVDEIQHLISTKPVEWGPSPIV